MEQYSIGMVQSHMHIPRNATTRRGDTGHQNCEWSAWLHLTSSYAFLAVLWQCNCKVIQTHQHMNTNAYNGVGRLQRSQCKLSVEPTRNHKSGISHNVCTCSPVIVEQTETTKVFHPHLDVLQLTLNALHVSRYIMKHFVLSQYKTQFVSYFCLHTSISYMSYINQFRGPQWNYLTWTIVQMCVFQ